MAVSASATTALADLPLEYLSLYHTVDSYLSSILVFYGPVATANATVSSSRIQAHIFTPAGFQSYSRITISPAAPLYAAVNHLPRDKQGDPVCRGLAVSMLKYFAELSDPLKRRLTEPIHNSRQGGAPPKLFDEMHAADLANRMTKVEDSSDIVRDLRSTFQERRIPWADIDVVLPSGIIQPLQRRESAGSEWEDEQEQSSEYGPYTALILALGDPMFLPTSRLKRAPSQPTNVSKSRIFARSQKEALRLTMCELVDTEERYVAKLYSLVHEVADEFRQKAQGKGPSSTSPNETQLAQLFPPCLNEILEVNLGFLDDIRQVLDETEKDALTDISQDTELSHRGSRETRDSIGAVSFAKALLAWLPRFSEPYAEYMRAHTGFTQILSTFMKDKNSSFSKRVYETGEQRLRSLLMEPVQRLPRYSLLIDTMTGSLPLVHPAVRPLLKARDLVKDICALDDASPSSHAQSLKRLRELVDAWPAKIFPEGRLITAVDVNEVVPPYQLSEQPSTLGAGIMLLYKNCLVVLAKPEESRTTARGLLADIDNAASPTNDMSMSLPSGELKVIQVLELPAVRCMQSICGRMLFVVPASYKTNAGTLDSGYDLLALELTATYEGKASRLIEEITKAKIEGRFPEKEREGSKWTLRSPPGSAGSTSILACVCEDGETAALDRPRSCPIRLVFDMPKAMCSQILTRDDIEVIVSVSPPNGDQFRLDIESVVGMASTDLVSADTFVPTLTRRLQNLLMSLHSPRNPNLVKPLVHSNFAVIRFIASSLIAQAKSSRGFRPPSPTKLLSNLLGGSRENAPNLKGPSSATLLGEFPKMPPPTRPTHSRSNTLPSTFSGKEKDKQKEETPSKISVVGATDGQGPESQLGYLQQTFAAYVLSLQSRSGNILGRMLRSRENADRSPVNELYNILLENPSKLQAAAEVPVDTLFVAFETFMKNAWKDSMGPVLDVSSLKTLQNQFDTMFPHDFDEQFRKFLADTSPQNRRALAAIVRLLAELLDASGNDGDRGALTMAFAEVLTEEGDPVQHVSLLDRLVEDFDSLFEEFIPGGASVEGTLSCDPNKQSSHTSAGSVSSNNSSFRKRFGFGLHKESHKNEGESKVASILRTLSKRQSPGDSEPNTPKGSLIRSKSTDVDARLGLLRPASRDRPYGFASEEQISRPGTGHGEPPSLSSIRGISQDGVVKVRRKRRSSLSDFRPPTASSDASYVSPTHPLRPVTPSSHPRGEATTPTSQSRPQSSYLAVSPARSASPTKATSPARLGSPIRRMSPPRPSTPSRKENIDPTEPHTEPSTKTKPDLPESPPPDTKRRSRATSIPQRTPGLRERPATNGSDTLRPQSSSSSPQKPQKLRMQSPQKLRDRVQQDKRAQATSQAGMRDELRALGDELQALRLTPTKQSSPDRGIGITGPLRPSGTKSSLEGRLRSLESRFDSFTGEFNDRTSALEKDLESSLTVSEKRVKKLDELYREASAENEALYDRFNSELSKIAKDVRSGNGEDALKSQLSNAMEEIGRLKKENLRLKREVGGLRAQQAAVALLRASEQ